MPGWGSGTQAAEGLPAPAWTLQACLGVTFLRSPGGRRTHCLTTSVQVPPTSPPLVGETKSHLCPGSHLPEGEHHTASGPMNLDSMVGFLCHDKYHAGKNIHHHHLIQSTPWCVCVCWGGQGVTLSFLTGSSGSETYSHIALQWQSSSLNSDLCDNKTDAFGISTHFLEL